MIMVGAMIRSIYETFSGFKESLNYAYNTLRYGTLERSGFIDENTDLFNRLVVDNVWDLSCKTFENYIFIDGPETTVHKNNVSSVSGTSAIAEILGLISKKQNIEHNLSNLHLKFEYRTKGDKSAVLIYGDELKKQSRGLIGYSTNYYYDFTLKQTSPIPANIAGVSN